MLGEERIDEFISLFMNGISVFRKTEDAEIFLFACSVTLQVLQRTV